MSTAFVIPIEEPDDSTLNTQKVVELLHAIPSAKVLAELAAIDPNTLPMASRIDYLTAIERQESWIQALMHRAIVAVAGRESTESDDPIYGIDEAEREDVSTALRVSPGSAQIKIDIARALTNHLPNTCSALAVGEISAAHANAIARETVSALNNGLPESVIFEIENRAIAYSEFHTPAQVGNLVRKVIATSTPAEFEETVADAREMRRVSCFNDLDGMSTIVALLPAHEAQVVMNAIESFIIRARKYCAQCESEGKLTPETSVRSSAENSSPTLGSTSLGSTSLGSTSLGSTSLGSTSLGSTSLGSSPLGTANSSIADTIIECNHVGGDQRSKDMKRADALAAIASQFLSSTLDDVTPHRRPLTVNVTIDLPTLMGLAENPGDLAGYGPIPASVAREIAADARWKRFITDPITGNLLDFGREHYEPPQALKDFLIARDRTCRFPGCSRSATLSDLDHAKSWESGGETSTENLGALCRRHHKLKTHHGWRVESFADGSCLWKSPAGKEFFTPARSVS
jgi:hypothetical protein